LLVTVLTKVSVLVGLFKLYI